MYGLLPDAEEARHRVACGGEGEREHARARGDDATVERPAFVNLNTLCVPRAERELFRRRHRGEHGRDVFRRVLTGRVDLRIHAHGTGRVWEAYLQVGIHAQHVVPLRLPEAADDRAAEAALCCADDDADVVAFTPKVVDSFYGAVAGVVVYDDDFNLVRADGRAGLRQCAEDTGDEGAQVAIFPEGRDNDRVVNAGHVGPGLGMFGGIEEARAENQVWN